MDHKDDDYERVIREIVRLLQQGFDATMQLLRFVVQFILQLPEMIMNLDFEQLRQALLSAGQESIQFVIAHERRFALVSFILSILLGFPIGVILGVLLIITQLIFLGILHCIGWTTQGVARGSWAASYQSRTYGGHVPAGSHFSRNQSRAAIGLRVPVNHPWVMLLSWILMIASIALYNDSWHRGQV